jgi:hypothetical protein
MHRCAAACVLALFATIGCQGGAGAPGETDGVNAAKVAAAGQVSNGKADGANDPCLANGWYGDGECDAFCAEPDPDCDVCARLGLYGDGVCDPSCVRPDPDCAATCPELEAGPQRGWKHSVASLLVTHAGDPHHSTVEPIVTASAGAVIKARFAYGIVGKELEDEPVEGWIRTAPCGPWVSLGDRVTNSEGEVSFRIDGGRLAQKGVYDFRVVAHGDLSRAVGAIHVVKPGQAAVVFDIDGSLTTGDSEMYKQVLLGTDPAMRTGADLVVARYADRGYQPVYLTARPAVLDLVSRRWLAEHGFPAGPLHTTVSLGEAVPTNGGVGAYKRDHLRAWEQSPRLVFVAAYGNSTTDIFAYAQAGIAPSNTFIVGDHGGEAAAGYAPTQAVTDFLSHLQALASLPPAP